ncbi:MAG: YraN family protein [Candidatus Saccharimonadales bacterium]
MAKNTTLTGQKAEQAAATYLEMRGYKVLERNWRRPKCEIDIIAKKDNIIFFVEVKYRRDYEQGGGLEAITATKLKQMQYAAQMWVEETEWVGNYQLAAIEIAGKEFAVMSFIENAF